MASHMGSATPDQIETLLNFLDEHRDLARGRLRSVEAKVQAKRLWEHLCNILNSRGGCTKTVQQWQKVQAKRLWEHLCYIFNSRGGCTKTVQQWQKVWFDRKHLAKKAAAASRRSASGTGGGPSMAPPLTQWELKVLSIMGDGFGEPQTGAILHAFAEINDPTPSTSSICEEISVEVELPNLLNQQTQSQPVSRESLASRRPPTRRRQRAVDSSVRSRLYEIEDERAERERTANVELSDIKAKVAGIRVEVAGIRAALTQLCDLVTELIKNKDKH